MANIYFFKEPREYNLKTTHCCTYRLLRRSKVFCLYLISSILSPYKSSSFFRVLGLKFRRLNIIDGYSQIAVRPKYIFFGIIL